MDVESNHILPSTVSSILSLTTHTRGGRTPALWREPPTRAPLRSRLGNFTCKLMFPGVLEGSLHQQRNEFTAWQPSQFARCLT